MTLHYIDGFSGRYLTADKRRQVFVELIVPLVNALEAAGLVPRIGHDLETIVSIQCENSDRMALFQLADPKCQLDADESNSVVVTLEKDGKPLACGMTRLKWVETSLEEEMESLRFFYTRPQEMAADGEFCVVTAPTARTIQSCPVAFTGSVFVHQSVTAGIAVHALLRLLNAWVAAHWHFTWLGGLAKRAQTRKYGQDVYGFPSAELGVWRMTSNQRLQDREYFLLTAPRHFCMQAHLTSQLARFEVPVCVPSSGEIQRAKSAAIR